MSHITIPEGYQSLLGLYDTQKAIGLIKTIFGAAPQACHGSPVCHAGQRSE